MDLNNFKYNKAFLHDEKMINGKFVIGNMICINTKGEKLFELPDKEMICVDFLEDDFTQVALENKIAFINSKGEFLTDFVYGRILDYDEEYKLYSVTKFTENDIIKYGCVNNKGVEVISCIYDSEILFFDDIATVKKGEFYGGIDTAGKIIIPFEYKRLGFYHEGLIVAKNFNDETGVIDVNNKIIIPFGKYSSVSSFSCGFSVAYSKEYGNVYIDKNGEILQLKKQKNKGINLWQINNSK